MSKLLPMWRCHKVVRAIKIGSVVRGNPATFLVPENGAYKSIEVGDDWIARHTPSAPGYYVVYDDGYASWSPPAAFEAGYTRIPDEP